MKLDSPTGRSGARWLAVAALGLVSGCASVQHNCPLGEECVGTHDVYEAAVGGGGDSESVLPGAGGPRAELEASGSDLGFAEQGTWRPYAGGGLSDRPLYQPPQPVRIWLAPWQASDGWLRSGQYLYVTREGGWSFGELREPGVGADLLGPRRLPGITPAEEEPSPTRTDRVQPEQNLLPGGDR